jgi:hypothetical protein
MNNLRHKEKVGINRRAVIIITIVMKFHFYYFLNWRLTMGYYCGASDKRKWPTKL